jgi:hypothetical protein
MDEVLPWIMLALMAIGFFTCLRFVWRLPRLLRRKRAHERILDELMRRNHEAALTYLSALLKDAETHRPAPRDLERNGAGRDRPDLTAAPHDGAGQTRIR